MKKYPFVFLCLFAFSCVSNRITDVDRKNVLAELEYIYNIDQKFAGVPPEELFEKYGNNKAWEIFLKKRDSVGIDNQKRIKSLYSKYGYLGYDKVGKKETDFWITIQHADNDVPFQQKMLKVLKKEIRKNNADRSHYAMLEDRIAINLNRKQRFGSQVTYNKLGQAIPKIGLIDSINIDKLREKYNLPLFKEYYNKMTIMHYEMNKEYLNKLGVKEPVLYK